MKKFLGLFLSLALTLSMFSGFALADETDLSSLTFGNGWKIDTSKEYVGDQYKRFDGLEFTRIVNTSGFDLPEGMTIDDNDRVWMFTLITGLQPKTLWSAAGDAFNQKKSAAITSGEIPDLMQVDMNQYYALVKAGLLADLTDELTEGPHPSLQALYAMGDNRALDTLRINGRIYGIPEVSMNFDGSPIVWIRQDWMDKLGLEAPKTYADLEEIALAFMQTLGWVGPDVWYAHGIHFNDEELKLLAETGTGVCHCPASNMKLSSGIARIPDMLRLGVPVGLGVDGSASNDGSSLMEELRTAFLLHRLNSSREAPSGYDVLKIATRGSARLLGRSDIGQLAVGKCCDLFLIDSRRMELVGACYDPKSVLATVGVRGPVDYTVVNGKITVREGRLARVDEEKLACDAQKKCTEYLEK